MKRLSVVVGLGILVLLSAPKTTEAQERVVLEGEPTVKVESGPKGTFRDSLSESQSRQYRIVIVERDGRYYWKSREGRELTRAGSTDQYTYFMDTQGGGYVKVLNQGSVSGVQYFEHLSLGLATLTYWGGVSRFDP